MNRRAKRISKDVQEKIEKIEKSNGKKNTTKFFLFSEVKFLFFSPFLGHKSQDEQKLFIVNTGWKLAVKGVLRKMIEVHIKVNALERQCFREATLYRKVSDFGKNP